MNKIEIEVNKLINIINDKITQYYSIYHCEPKVIIVTDYVEYVIRTDFKARTNVAFNDREYSTFMGVLMIGTKNITDIEQIEVF